MHVKIIGYRKLDFFSNGEKVCGTQIFHSFPEDGIVGEVADKIFIREGSMELPPLKIGQLLDVSFNRKGKPVAISAVPGSKTLNLG